MARQKICRIKDAVIHFRVVFRLNKGLRFDSTIYPAADLYLWRLFEKSNPKNITPKRVTTIVHRLEAALRRKKRPSRKAKQKPQIVVPTSTPTQQAAPPSGITPFAAFKFVEVRLLADIKRELPLYRSESDHTQALWGTKNTLTALGASAAQIAEFEKGVAELRKNNPPPPAYRIHQKYGGGGG